MSTQEQDIAIGQFILNLQSKTITSPQGIEHKLNWKTFSVLQLLLQNLGLLVTRKQLIDEVWEGNYPVGDKALSTAIWNLRKLFADSEVFIETIPKKGFRLSIISRSETEKEKSQDEVTQLSSLSNDTSHHKSKNWILLTSLLVILVSIGASYLNNLETSAAKHNVALLIRTTSTETNNEVDNFIVSLQTAAKNNSSLISSELKTQLLVSEDHFKFAREHNVASLLYVELILIDKNNVTVKAKTYQLENDLFFMNSWQVTPQELDSLIPPITAELVRDNWQ